MRAISLWEPWGTAIALGLKRNETRHWSTDYRGPLAIHCAKTRDAAKAVFSDVSHGLGETICEALATVGITSPDQLNFGKVVCVCRLVRVVRTELFTEGRGTNLLTSQERAFGNYDPGRFAWVLEDVRPLAVPFAFRGGQGFFNISDDLFPEELRR